MFKTTLEVKKALVKKPGLQVDNYRFPIYNTSSAIWFAFLILDKNKEGQIITRQFDSATYCREQLIAELASQFSHDRPTALILESVDIGNKLKPGLKILNAIERKYKMDLSFITAYIDKNGNHKKNTCIIIGSPQWKSLPLFLSLYLLLIRLLIKNPPLKRESYKSYIIRMGKKSNLNDYGHISKLIKLDSDFLDTALVKKEALIEEVNRKAYTYSRNLDFNLEGVSELFRAAEIIARVKQGYTDLEAQKKIKMFLSSTYVNPWGAERKTTILKENPDNWYISPVNRKLVIKLADILIEKKNKSI